MHLTNVYTMQQHTHNHYKQLTGADVLCVNVYKIDTVKLSITRYNEESKKNDIAYFERITSFALIDNIR